MAISISITFYFFVHVLQCTYHNDEVDMIIINKYAYGYALVGLGSVLEYHSLSDYFLQC